MDLRSSSPLSVMSVSPSPPRDGISPTTTPPNTTLTDTSVAKQPSVPLLATPTGPSRKRKATAPHQPRDKSLQVPWNNNHSMMRYALLYIFQTKYVNLDDVSRRTLVPRVFSLAFRDQLDQQSIEGDVAWSTLRKMYLEHCRVGGNTAKAWLAISAENQTAAQIAAAAEAKERVDVADAVVGGIEGGRSLDLEDERLAFAVRRQVIRVVPREMIDLARRIEALDDDELIWLLEAMFLTAVSGEAAGTIISYLDSSGSFVKLCGAVTELSETYEPVFGILETFTNSESPLTEESKKTSKGNGMENPNSGQLFRQRYWSKGACGTGWNDLLCEWKYETCTTES